MPVETDPDTVQRLVGIGDEVVTPEGSGIVVDIILSSADYPDGTELEPPGIGVELDNGETIYTCICQLGLEDESATELLHSEYYRLWPLKDGPEDVEMLIPEKEEVMSRFDSRTARASYFCVSCGDTIFGVGRSRDAAVEHAKNWIDPINMALIKTDPTWEDIISEEYLVVLPCTCSTYEKYAYDEDKRPVISR
jgi:hypothetical protein